MLHGRLNEVIIGRFDEAIILGQHIDNSTTTICDISLNSARKADIIWCEHEDFEVHLLAEPILNDGMNAFKDDDRSAFNCLSHIRTFV